MASRSPDTMLKGLDARMTRVERILPDLLTRKEFGVAVARLATREELRDAVARLATKEELRAAVAPLATKEELRAAIASAIAPLATKEEVRLAIASAIAPLMTKEDLRAATASLAPKVLLEAMQDQMKVIIDAVAHNATSLEELRQEMGDGFRKLDRRVTRLEARASLEGE